jgi:hypothetical protein
VAGSGEGFFVRTLRASDQGNSRLEGLEDNYHRSFPWDYRKERKIMIPITKRAAMYIDAN